MNEIAGKLKQRISRQVSLLILFCFIISSAIIPQTNSSDKYGVNEGLDLSKVNTMLKPRTYFFDKYGVNEGLGSSKVYTIIQDSKDYLWVGTASGVSRFGGRQIENFSVDDGLAMGGVKSMHETASGEILFGHINGGLSVYDGKGFRNLSFDSLAIQGDINSLNEIDGRIWLTTLFGGAISVVYNPATGMLHDIRQYKGEQGLSDQLSGSFIDLEGNLYCFADVGIKRYVKDEDRFETYRPEGLSSFFSIITMFQDSRKDTWFGTHNGGLYRMDAESGKIKIFDIRDGLASNWISSITEDSKGRIWVGTWGGGITRFEGDEMKTFDNTNGLEAMEIQSLYEDHEGNIIIASQNSGLFIFKGDYFVNYISDMLFTDKNVTAVSEDRFGRLWFGTNMGITLFDPENDFIWRFNEENKNISNKIKFIRNDLDGNVWIGTDDRGVYRYSFEENRFVPAADVNNILYRDLVVTAMDIDQSNNLWIGTNEGVAFWNISKEEGKRYTQIDGIYGNIITALSVGLDGKIWIGTEKKDGLTCYNPVENRFKIIDTGYDLAPTSICQSVDSTLWIGTTYGIIGLRGDSLVVHLTVSDGLLSDNINLLQPDNNGFLYIGTNLGLNRYNLDNGVIKTFTRSNGFIGTETKRNASIIDSRGLLWFGTSYGVSCLDPSLIPPPDPDPLTHIEGMLVNLIPMEMSLGLKLSYKQKSIVFDYYSICLTNPAAVRYQVMLKGSEDDWRPETVDTRAVYSALSPGKYTFMVKAVNSDGIWNEEPVTYSFTIRPPFYFSPLFILIVFIIIVVSIISYIKLRERNLLNEKRILEEKVEERTMEVVHKSLEIEEKNRDITASIRYAERIQMAMLPPEDSFDQTFVLFKPKDIVSGDFYWMHDNGDYQFIAAVDCTGHGVPGAFMSIIGFNSLTKIVREYGLTRPAAILDQLNVEVTRSLLQRGEKAISDGMDLSLVTFSKKAHKIQFAGAYNPIVIVSDGKVETIKADRFPIGMEFQKARKFTNHEVNVKSGDMIYLFSDGFSDQFGGSSGKKFKVVSLKNAFSVIYNLEMQAQKDYLEELLYDWMGDQPQVDDILVIGTRVP